jgi:hypothetical protein
MYHKLAIFYIVEQLEDWWGTQFYTPQIQMLKDTGLYDKIDFIDISIVGNKQPLPFVPDKIKSINYIKSIKESEYDEFMMRIWEFSRKNPEYKILHFHSHGVSHKNSSPQLLENKFAWNDFMNYCNIELWEKCVELLNFYDCVGAETLKYATYYPDGNLIDIYAPHFPGDFWWANTSYIAKLDPIFLSQKIIWKNYLNELWIGTGNPRMYEFYHTGINFYNEKVKFNKQEILNKVNQEINTHKHKALIRVPYTI